MVVEDGQALIMHKGDVMVLGTFQMLVEMTWSRNVEFLVSCSLRLLSDELTLSLFFTVSFNLCHLIYISDKDQCYIYTANQILHSC